MKLQHLFEQEISPLVMGLHGEYIPIPISNVPSNITHSQYSKLLKAFFTPSQRQQFSFHGIMRKNKHPVLAVCARPHMWQEFVQACERVLNDDFED